MDLSSPLATLTSPLEAGVLRVLARADTEFSGRQVHRLSGVGSAPGVWKALGRLSGSGLVVARERPAETLYRLNREHVLYPVIVDALDAGVTVFDRIREFSAANAPNGTTVYVFGSVARGEARSDSDVDLLLIAPSDADEGEIDEFRDRLATSIEAWTGNAASIITRSPDAVGEMVRTEAPLALSWKQDAKRVFGPELPALVQ